MQEQRESRHGGSLLRCSLASDQGSIVPNSWVRTTSADWTYTNVVLHVQSAEVDRRARRRGWRDRRRERDLAVVRGDFFPGAYHSFFDDGLARRDVAAVVHAHVGRFHLFRC